MRGPTVIVETARGRLGHRCRGGGARRARRSTLLLNTKEAIILPHLRKVSYDPLASFESICLLVSSPTVISVNVASPYRTLADLIETARAKPAALTMASSGPASPFQIGFEMLKRAASVDMTFVPYPGVAPAVNAILGAHVDSALTTYSSVAEQLKAGKLRALAAASKTRIEALPDLPTLAESGYGGFDIDIWDGLVAPAKTPKETVAQLAALFAAATRAPEVKAKLAPQGLYPVDSVCGADFDALIRRQYDEYAASFGMPTSSRIGAAALLISSGAAGARPQRALLAPGPPHAGVRGGRPAPPARRKSHSPSMAAACCCSVLAVAAFSSTRAGSAA